MTAAGTGALRRSPASSPARGRSARCSRPAGRSRYPAIGYHAGDLRQPGRLADNDFANYRQGDQVGLQVPRPERRRRLAEGERSPGSPNWTIKLDGTDGKRQRGEPDDPDRRERQVLVHRRSGLVCGLRGAPDRLVPELPGQQHGHLPDHPVLGRQPREQRLRQLPQGREERLQVPRPERQRRLGQAR